MSSKKRKRSESVQPLSSPPPPPTAAGIRAEEGWHDYLREGLPVGAMAFGFGVMTTGWFKTGIAFFYFGAWWLAYDVTGRRFFRKLAQRWQNSALAGYVAVLAAFSWQYIFVPASIEVYANLDTVHYGAGSVIDGIPWEPDYAQMTLTLENLTDNDYLDFDATISTDREISGFRQASGLAICATDVIGHVPHIFVQSFTNGVPSGPAGNSSGQPSGTEYRLRCDKLPSHNQNYFVLALRTLNPTQYNIKTMKMGVSKYLAPQPATWLMINAKFTLLGRERHIDIFRCAMGHTCDISRRIDVSSLGLSDKSGPSGFWTFKDKGQNQQ